ncbi:U3 small nucleolar RNA-associated protein 4 homolog [Tachysurus fulvidraco]|uniref:U3 small nucleolar RNA-associated protein 4 homolog n=1 Tax=Tachysurus fulvidraco TaxID=1234273 RepID=UPI000F50C125|nr:U3 small nucleolar RNA-associated protein 4 homolog [Tachysurus fulvidraco]XP_027017809.1 U3 small nucleolar RNA-associated protein 4 homolog [Tachysurus fulvidraco]
MGEFKVHRVRFFDYMPSAIQALAFEPQHERIAAARADGSVEIYNVADNLFQEKVIPGQEKRATEALTWAGERLFSAGLNGEIVEYDLDNHKVKYTLDAYGGPIWAIASNKQGTHLAVGCEDGTVKLFEVCEGKIQFERNLAKQKGRIISLSWHPSGSRIAAGMMDMIRVFDTETGQSVHRLLVERGIGTAKVKECVVWSVVYLRDGTIVSGDSSGKVNIWDDRTGTLIKRHQVTKWDVLTLSASQDETSVVAGTSEGTVAQFQFLSMVLGQEEKEWVRTRTFKNHTHDVRAVLEINTAVVSGGMDTQLVMRPLLDKIEVKTTATAFRKIHFPHRSLVSCVKKTGLLLFQYPTHLDLWRLGESDGSGMPGSSLPIKRKPEKLLHLKIKGEDHVRCSAVSPCGEWIAYSTVASFRLYRLHCDNNNVSITKVSKLPKIFSSANQICFSSDSSRLFVASSSSAVHVAALSQTECKLVSTLKSKSGSAQAIHLLAASEDGKWLASANSDHEVHVYNLKKMKVHCTVPIYNSGVSAMAIHPTTNNLFMVHADQQLFEYSLEQKQYTDWSRLVQKNGLHHVWLERDTPVTNVTFSRKNPAHVLLHDMYMFCVIDQTLPLPDQKSQFYNQLTLRSLPEKERTSQSHAFKVCKTYKELLFAGLMEDQSLVVVERPLLEITAQLPPPVRQKKFAT